MSAKESRQTAGPRAPPSFSSHQPPFPRQQQPFTTGGHGWDRVMQAQQVAFQQNMNRGGAGPAGYQQRYDQRGDEWSDRRDNRSQQQAFSRSYPPPPPSRRYHWN